jgi:3-oxoacyl-[acyl-carrier protein] reductase
MIGGVSSAQQRVALVTGSSRGLGRVIAMRLAGDGFAIAVNGLHDNRQALIDVVDSIKRSGGAAAPFPADVTDEYQVNELVADVGGLLGSVDVLVLNATGPQPEAAVNAVVWEEHAAQLDFFVKSPRCSAGRFSRECRRGTGAASCTSTPRSLTGSRQAGRLT